MMRKTPMTPALSSSPRERIYAEEEFIDWIHEAKEAAYLGADMFERNFNIAGEKIVCRIAFHWSGKADQAPRISRLECVPEELLELHHD